MNQRLFRRSAHLRDEIQALLVGAAIVTVLATPLACKREMSLPQTSPEAEQLRWVEHADVLADFRQHVEQEHDMRFLSKYGLSFGTEFPGLQETAETQRLVKQYLSRRIDGGDDVIRSWEQERLMHEVTWYASTYNSMLLGYLECKFGPDSASR
jgi:hypothetical protein